MIQNSSQHLYEKLTEYAESDCYPYHMPGHKRRVFGGLPGQMMQMDITEIDGFDNLHQPEEILAALQRKASELYGSEESYYLINGSTCGILSAISASLPMGGHLLMARNCHKSAYHGVYLRQLKVTYLYPPLLSGWNIYDAVTPDQVRQALEQDETIGAVLIVSPTYEGRIADVAGIAEAVHERGIPLIVDEAHGAHLGLAEGLVPNSCQAGADVVIHSVHKTLPAMTQTALLHVNGNKIDRDVLRRFLHIYQSSSPSYILMASIDNALQIVEEKGKEIFVDFYRRYLDMEKELSRCRQLKVLPYEKGKQDIGKLVISTSRCNFGGNQAFTGKQLYDTLRRDYHLQPEMAAGDYCLAMFTIGDTPEAYERMTAALLAIDEKLQREYSGLHDRFVVQDAGGKQDLHEKTQETEGKAIPLAQAWDMEWEKIFLEDAVERMAADFMNLYPPGVPILVPGEKLTKSKYDIIVKYIEEQLNVQGIERSKNGICIRVLKQK